MTTQNIPLFEALGAKMSYLAQRQRIIAQNIANADTPGYRPQDLKPVDFGAVLKKVTGDQQTVTLNATNPGHMPDPEKVAGAKSEKQKRTYEVAPAGNAVILEEQMIRSNDTIMDYNLMTTLYEKNVRLIKIALGQ